MSSPAFKLVVTEADDGEITVVVCGNFQDAELYKPHAIIEIKLIEIEGVPGVIISPSVQTTVQGVKWLLGGDVKEEV